MVSAIIAEADQARIARPGGEDLVVKIIKPGFTEAEWAQLSVIERIARCYQFAREAAQLAEKAAPDAKPHHKAIAAHWIALAGEIERTAQPASPNVAAPLNGVPSISPDLTER